MDQSRRFRFTGLKQRGGQGEKPRKREDNVSFPDAGMRDVLRPVLVNCVSGRNSAI